MDGRISLGEGGAPDHEQLEALLQRMAPPENPADVFGALPDLERALNSFAPLDAFATVAGDVTP